MKNNSWRRRRDSKKIMDKKDLKQAIKKLLETSKISEHLKNIVNTLLDVMDEAVLNNIYTALLSEKEKMDKIAEKKKRVELKYQVMVEKLSDMNTKK